MPNEVVANHSGIVVPPPAYNEVSELLLAQLGLKMPAANVEVLFKILGSAHRNETERPSKPSLAEQLTRLRDNALGVQQALASSPILHWLNKADPELLAKQLDYWTDMDKVWQAAETAVLMTPKEGRGRSATPEEISPRAVCALLVAELFELSGQEQPRPTTRKAHAIADVLWRASGGRPWTGQDLASWRRYFGEMTRARPEYRQALRSLVRMRRGTE